MPEADELAGEAPASSVAWRPVLCPGPLPMLQEAG